MGKIEVILPKMGESVAEATVTSWLVNVGDKVEMEDGILEIATDKVDSEVPAPKDGVLIKQLCAVGDVVQVGAPVAVIEFEGEEEGVEHQANKSFDAAEIAEDAVLPSKTINTPQNAPKKSENPAPIHSKSERFYSPLVRSIAKKEGIGQEELDAIPGTGKNNRLTKDDLLAYLQRGNSNAHPTPNNAGKENIVAQISAKPSEPVVSGEDEIIEMDRVRKLIAKHMHHSTQVAPHVTSFVEADVTNMVKWRNKIKNDFVQKEGYKITFTPIFIEAVAKALKDFPMVNISVDGEKIIKKKHVNVGLAVALPNGNLIVPVIKDADQLNLRGLAAKVNELSVKARNNKLTQEDVTGGTFTLTNAGTFGNVMGTPIINQPEVAILAVGVIQKKPAVIETEDGDVIAIRHKMFLSMSYDHRVVDGMLGGSFLKRAGDYLESFDGKRNIW